MSGARETHLRRFLPWYLVAWFVLLFAQRTAFVLTSDGRVHDEMYWYLGESQFFGGLDGAKIYLGAPSLGVTGEVESWRIPSFLFYNVNYWLLEHVGSTGLLLFISWMGVLALFVFFLFVRRVWPSDPLAQLLSVVVAGLVPYNLFLTTGVWNPNYLWLWVALGLYGLVALVQARTRAEAGIALIGVSVALCIAAQYHLTAYFQLPAVLVVLGVMYADRTRRPYLPPLWSLVMAALPWAVLTAGYFYWDARFDYANTQAVLAGGTGRKISTPFDNLNAIVGFASAGSSDISLFYREHLQEFFARYFGHPSVGFLLVGAHFAVILFAMFRVAARVRQTLRRDGWRQAIREHPEFFALASWTITPVLVLTLLLKSYNTRYAVWVAPLSAMLQVWAWLELVRADRPPDGAAGAAAGGTVAPVPTWRRRGAVALRLGFVGSVAFMIVLSAAMIDFNRHEFLEKRRMTGPNVVRILAALRVTAPASAGRFTGGAPSPPVFVTHALQSSQDSINTAELNTILASPFSRDYWRKLVATSADSARISGESTTFVLVARGERTAAMAERHTDLVRVAATESHLIYARAPR